MVELSTSIFVLGHVANTIVNSTGDDGCQEITSTGLKSGSVAETFDAKKEKLHVTLGETSDLLHSEYSRGIFRLM